MSIPLSLQKAHQSLIRVNVNCDHQSTENLSNFSVALPGQFNQFRNVVAAQVLSVTIPNAFDNITEGKDSMNIVHTFTNTLATPITTTSVSTDVTVREPGQYNIQDLGHLFSGEQLEINGDTHDYLPNLNPNTPSVLTNTTSGSSQPLFTSKCGFNWELNRFQLAFTKTSFISVGATHPLTTLPTVTLSGPLAFALGFYEKPHTFTCSFADNGTVQYYYIVAPRLPALVPFNEFYIGCKELANDSMIIDRNGSRFTDIIAVVSTAGAVPGELIHYSPQHPLIYEYFQGSRSINRLTLSLRDCHGDPLKFVGNNWFLTLKLFYTLSY